MAEMGEGIAIMAAALDEDAKCDYEPPSESWKANLDGSGTALGNNLGNKPDASSEADLTATAWPSQAHHLIPHKTLKEHPVAKWLKKGDFLFADTYYNVDHANNGKWMPYASSLKEWKKKPTKKADIASNRALMFKVMSLSQIQLHQGRHSSSDRYGIGDAPYKERVKSYLKKIKNNAVSHYAGKKPCQDCKGKQQNGKYPPRANTVALVDVASKCIESDINEARIFVSKIAAEFAEAGGFTTL